MNSEDLLIEYEIPSKKKPGIYQLLVVLIMIAIGILNLAIYSDSGTFEFDWMNIVFAILIPGTGLAFLIAGKKAGWVISFIFFTLFLSMMIGSIVEDVFFDSTNRSTGMSVKVRQATFFILASSIFVLLATKVVRKYLRVGRWMLIITALCALSLSLVAIVSILV